MLKRIDADLFDWVEFHTRQLEDSGIGMPSATPVSRMMEYGITGNDGNYGSHVPLLGNAPPHVKRLDKVLPAMPDELLAIVRQHYIERSTARTRKLYRQLDRLHYTLQGALMMVR
jgi:hypothetical protein